MHRSAPVLPTERGRRAFPGRRRIGRPGRTVGPPTALPDRSQGHVQIGDLEPGHDRGVSAGQAAGRGGRAAVGRREPGPGVGARPEAPTQHRRVERPRPGRVGYAHLVVRQPERRLAASGRCAQRERQALVVAAERSPPVGVVGRLLGGPARRTDQIDRVVDVRDGPAGQQCRPPGGVPDARSTAAPGRCPARPAEDVAVEGRGGIDVAGAAVRHHDRLVAADRPERRDVERHRPLGVQDGQVGGQGVQSQRSCRCCGLRGGRGRGGHGLPFRCEQRPLDAGAQRSAEPRVGVHRCGGGAEGVQRVGHREPPSPSAA